MFNFFKKPSSALIGGQRFRQTCPACGWQSKIVLDSDVIFGYSQCPKCHSKLTLKPLSVFTPKGWK